MHLILNVIWSILGGLRLALGYLLAVAISFGIVPVDQVRDDRIGQPA